MKPNNIVYGMPTAPSVKLLLDAFGTPEKGKLIGYDAIADIIREERGSNRYVTIVSAWRRTLYREHNIHMRAEAGKGLVAASNSERVHISSVGVDRGLRQTKRAGALAFKTAEDGLNEEESRARLHTITIASTITMAAMVESKRNKAAALALAKL